MFDELFARAVEKILKDKSSTTICLFDKGDFYLCFNRDAHFVAKEIFKSLAIIKTSTTSAQSDSKIQYVTINKNQFENILREVLLFYQYRVELYHCVNSKIQDWQLKTEASPGNLASFEDILIESGNVDSTTVIAVKFEQSSDKLKLAIGCCDLSSQLFKVAEFVDSTKFCVLESLLVRVAPKECLICSSDTRNVDCESLKTVLRRANVPITERKSGEFKAENVHQDLNRLLKFRKGEIADCTAFPHLSGAAVISCLSALIKYLNLLQDNANHGKFRLETLPFDNYLRLDSSALKSLEIFDAGCLARSSNSGIGNTLCGLMNKCRTSAGKKLLNEWIRMPLLDVNKINERMDAVDTFVENKDVLRTMNEDILNKVDDLPKILRAFGKNKADLQHVFKIYQAVQLLPTIKSHLNRLSDPKPVIKCMFLDVIEDILREFEKYISMVNYTLEINRKSTSYEVRIKQDFDENLKRIIDEMKEIQVEMNKQLQKAAKELGLEAEKSIKLENASHLGYFMRVTRKDEKVLRGNKNFLVLETQKAGVRFTTSSLKRLNEEYSKIQKQHDQIHDDIVKEVVSIANGYFEAMRRLCDLLANMDVILNFAEISSSAPIPFVRPKMLEKGSGILKLDNSRHPCLERQDNLCFIPNDVNFKKGECEFILLTGPNMGGKSTFLRQTALIVIMAQVGCFVPCSYAEISVIDGIFTRIGASDCQVKGVSTFMAEMIETSFILEAATENSLIVIDELGRGTSTYDGFGLAYAIAEHIAQKLHSFTLFATHFHELTALSYSIPTVKNFHVTAEVMDGRMTLLFQVKPGVCDESFGIYVAEMVKFPKHVLEDAWNKMKLYTSPEDTTRENVKKLKSVLEEHDDVPVAEKANILRKLMCSAQKF